MKTNMKHYLAIFLVLILFSNIGRSQEAMKSESPAPAPAAMAPVSSWQSRFTSDNLSSKDVEGYEVRAEQKVKDFYNYVSIISDSKYDIKLRMDAKKQALDLFSSESCTINKKPVDQYLDSCLNLKQAITLQVSNVTVKKKLDMPDGDPEYDGYLECTVSGTTKSVYIHLYKKAKQFGSSQEMIWTVFICDIE